MQKNIAWFTGILLLLSACAVQHTNLDANPAFTSHRYSSSDLEVLWKSEKTENGVRVQGTLTNPRSDLPYNSLELTAKLLDDNGKVLAKGNHAFPNRFAGSEPFSMDIPLAQKELVSRIKFSYSYGTVEDHFLRDFESLP